MTLQQRDRIIFLGDSITQAGVLKHGYISLSAQYINKTYPELNIELIGAGINGHKVPNCQQRLESDVLQQNPSIVIIYLGVNDVWHWQHHRGTTATGFAAGLNDIITRIQDMGAIVILCTPSVIGEKTDDTNTYDAMLEEYADISRAIAEATGSQLLDLRQRFLAYLKTHNSHNAKSGILTSDGVHLNKRGNQFVSDLMLEALNTSPRHMDEGAV